MPCAFVTMTGVGFQRSCGSGAMVSTASTAPVSKRRSARRVTSRAPRARSASAPSCQQQPCNARDCYSRLLQFILGPRLLIQARKEQARAAVPCLARSLLARGKNPLETRWSPLAPLRQGRPRSIGELIRVCSCRARACLPSRPSQNPRIFRCGHRHLDKQNHLLR